jgi:surface antigen
MRTILIILIGLTLTNCASTNRSQVGAVLGSTTTTGACVSMGVSDPYAIGAFAVVVAFAGAEIMSNSDYDVHNAVFVDHLNNGTMGSSYTNWYNKKTGNSGIIKVTKSYIEAGFKCKDYDATVDITSQWPLIGVGGVNRNTVFGTTCQLPDGRWVELK